MTIVRRTSQPPQSTGLGVRWLRVTCLVVALVYLVVLGYLVFAPVHAAAEFGTPINVVPLRSLRAQLTSSASPGHGAFELAGNGLLLAPLGVLLAGCWRVRRPWFAVLVGVAAAGSIEFLQWSLSTGRPLDIDDVLLNTLGCVGAYAAAHWVFTRTRLGPGFLLGSFRGGTRVA